MFQLEESFAAFGIDVVAHRRTAGFDGLAQNLLQALVELLKFSRESVTRRVAAAAPLRETATFVGVDVADAAQQLLVEQRALDRRLAIVEQRDEAFESVSSGS